MRDRAVLMLTLAALMSVALAQPVRASEMTPGPITVSVPGTAGPIVISDKTTVERFAPLGGGSWPVVGDRLAGDLDTSGLAGPYDVRFSMNLRASSFEPAFGQSTYELSYYRDEATGVGYILLFAHAYDPFFVPLTWYPLGWYEAGQAWDELMSQHLPHRRVWGFTVGVVLAVAVAAGIGLFVRKRRRATRAKSHRS